MSTITVLMPDGSASIPGRVHRGRALIDVDDLTAAIGWELKAEGLCRNDVCVPVSGLESPEIDLASVAGALGSTVLIDDLANVIAISVPSQDRKAGLVGRQAPEFTLPDLNGVPHSLGQFVKQKRLLIAFSSW